MRPAVRQSLPSLRLVSLAALLLTGTAHAQLPPLKGKHPHLFGTQLDFDTLKARLPALPAGFTSDGGALSFKLFAKAKGSTDVAESSVFGVFDSSRNSIVIRHLDGAGSNGRLRLQVALQRAGGGAYIAAGIMEVDPEQWSTIRVSWDSASHNATASANGTEVTTMWWLYENNRFTDWKNDGQRLEIAGHKGEQITDFEVFDKNQNSVLTYPTVDLDLSTAWRDFLFNARNVGAAVRACPTTEAPAAKPVICNVLTGHPNTVFDTAQQQALAYRLTGDIQFLDNARNYADKLLAIPSNGGGAYAMGGRVAALGILYDWLYGDLAGALPGDARRSYRTALAQAIKATVATVSSPATDDLNIGVCGAGANVTNTAASLRCTVEPIETFDSTQYPSPPSIARYYISGQQYRANHETALGLLAIAEEYPEVLPMIASAYTNFQKGFFRAREQISVDGAYITGFAYGASNIPQTLALWRSALDTGSGAHAFQGEWQKKLIYPYIYGLRLNPRDGQGWQEGSFPARGDNFDVPASSSMIGDLALMAATQGDDGVALGFLQKYGRGTSGSNPNRILQELVFPPTHVAPLGPEALPLSRHFGVAGEVLMRDTWDFPTATLLEFKASNFSSENHQHLDQNSFSLNYRAPLLVDSGVYDSYNSPHWTNYSTRTIAHNTITVFNPSERFMRYGIENDNDGGQWFPHPSYLYPTLADIQPNGMNYQAGVVNYEMKSAYTYTRGNASKAYSKDKMDQTKGFLRSLVFLPSLPFWQKPVTLVFDVVNTMNNLPANFLLHSVHEPAAAPAHNYLGDGRYKLDFASGASRMLTVRNGGGMATVQTLLPLDATVLKVGGSADSCGQGSAGALAKDCRFTSRHRLAGDTYAWRNYAPVENTNLFGAGDNGAWRIEIGAPNNAAGVPVIAPGAPQYFLHVIGVADNDNGNGMAAAPAALRLAADPNTEAVLLGTSNVVVFNKDAAPAGGLGWTVNAAQPAILALGLKVNTGFTLTKTLVPGGVRFQLLETADPAALLRSSDQGVVTLNF